MIEYVRSSPCGTMPPPVNAAQFRAACLSCDFGVTAEIAKGNGRPAPAIEPEEGSSGAFKERFIERHVERGRWGSRLRKRTTLPACFGQAASTAYLFNDPFYCVAGSRSRGDGPADDQVIGTRFERLGRRRKPF